MNTSTDSLEAQSFANRCALLRKTYPGRIVGVGMNDSGTHLVQITVIEGRDEKTSRNRRYLGTADQEWQGRVYTEIVDPSIVPPEADTKLLLYNAMKHCRSNDNNAVYVASNGDQTDEIYDVISREGSFAHAMETIENRGYEPDSSKTPRISALIHRCGGHHYHASLAIARKSDVNDSYRGTIHNVGALPQGFGYFLHTYVDDGNPLLSFSGEPILLPIRGDSCDQVAINMWLMLDPKYLAALAVKFIPIDHAQAPFIRIINASDKTPDGRIIPPPIEPPE